MSRLTFYLISILTGLITFTWIYPESAAFGSLQLQKIKALPQFKISLVCLLIGLGVYFALDYLNLKSEPVQKYYTKKISLDEYEIQKRSFTQMKLAELYNSKEYQEHAKRKMVKSQFADDEIEFSDEDL